MRILGLVLAALVVACAPKNGANAAPSLHDVLTGQVVAAGAISWSAGRPLTWEDFRGTPPATPGDEGARTAYSLFHGARCTGQRFEFVVIAAMLPRSSWVTANVLRNAALSARSLRHEQTHFDLSEVHARRMRRHFHELLSPCRRSETELNALAERFTRDEAQAQRNYDDDTNYGRNPGKQTEWNDEAARQIVLLKEFAFLPTSSVSR